MGLRLHKHLVAAPEARRFYFDLERAGASKRPSVGGSRAYLAFAPIGAVLVLLGFAADGMTAQRLWGVGAAMLTWPLFLLVGPWWLVRVYTLRLQGWTEPWDRIAGTPPGPPQLTVRHRANPMPMVQVGSRALALGRLRLAREASGLVVWDGERAVASLALGGEAASERTWDGRPKA